MKTPQESEPVNRYEATIDYVDSLGASEAARAESQASELFRQRGPLKDYVAIVPVAAHQEPLANVRQTLAQYARQEPRRPFTALIGLNHPNNERDAEQASRLLDQTEALIADEHKNFDVRVLHTSYDSPKIGHIRRDLWNTAIVAGLEGGTLSDSREMVGMNGDIDLVHAPRQTVAAVQKYGDAMLDSSRHQHIVQPYVVPARHSVSPEYPHSSAYLAWQDHLWGTGYVPYEVGVVMPFGFYALRRGIDPDAKQNEMFDAIDTDMATLHERVLRMGVIVTSGRRFIERLPGADLDDMWEEGSFGPDNTYRDGLDHCTDISWQRQTQLLLSTAAYAIASIQRGALRDAQDAAGGVALDNLDSLDKPMRRRWRLTSRLLDSLFDEYQCSMMHGHLQDEFAKIEAARQG